MNEFTCPCCGYKVFSTRPGNYEICPICFWQDDLLQLEDPSFSGGANHPSLLQAQENYKKIGVSDERFLGRTKKIEHEFIKDKKWFSITDLKKIRIVKNLYYWNNSSPLISKERFRYRNKSTE